MGNETEHQTFDVVIVGGGPAGLSAALILGRCRRRVALCDDGNPRNAASHAAHGFFTRDGTPPQELLRIGREQLRQYDVKIYQETVTDVQHFTQGFIVELASGLKLHARKLLLATGIVDEIPKLDGIDELYGLSVFHCPYCDGWERRDQPLAIYGRGKEAVGFALKMKTWSKDLVLCTDGGPALSPEDIQRLQHHRIHLRDERIVRLEGHEGMLERIIFAEGEPVERRALFFYTGTRQHCDLPAKLNCQFDEKGAVTTDSNEHAEMSGLYVAGDASQDVNLIAIAVAEGVKAAFAINLALQQETID